MRLQWRVLFVLLSLATVANVAAQSKVDAAQVAAAAFEDGQNAQARGDFTAAISFYSKAISVDASLFQAYYQRATAFIALGRDNEAEADLTKVLAVQPDFARAHRAMGEVFLDRGKTEEAKSELARALELEPKLTGVRIYYASALIKSGDAQRALDNLRVAITQGEASALAYALLGLAEERTNQAAAAFDDYSRAISIESANPIAREGRGRLFEKRGEFEKAIEDYTIAGQMNPSADVSLRLAALHAHAGQPQAAIRIYRRLLIERPMDFGIRADLARLLAENGQAEEARVEMARVVAAKPSDSKLLTAAGDVYFKDKPEAAAEFYRRAVDADANNNAARVQLGASLVRSMQYEPALPVLNEALRREANNYAGHANLATALFKLKQYPEAARQFIWLIHAQPETAASYFFLAISLDRLGDCDQSLRAYQEFQRRADSVKNKSELEDASFRISQLQRLIKDGKCRRK